MGEKEFGELKTVDYVDLERFMGDWYVIANIPTFIEKGAVNAVESYELDSEGELIPHLLLEKDQARALRKSITQRALSIILRQTLSGACSFFGHSRPLF